MRKIKLKKNIKIILFDILIISLLIIFSISTYKVITILYYDNKNEKDTLQLVKEVVKEIPSHDSQEETKVTNNYEINFTSLKNRNSDVVGWIMIPNTKINYPIVKGNDNTFYLTHNLDKEYNLYGMIYMNYKNKGDFHDNNTILFGHNSYNGTMFGELKKIYNGELKDEVKIFIYTEEGRFQYNVYATYIASPNDTNPLNPNIKSFSKTDRKFTYLDTGLETLTLSTCHTNRNKRLIIHAMLQDVILNKEN